VTPAPQLFFHLQSLKLKLPQPHTQFEGESCQVVSGVGGLFADVLRLPGLVLYLRDIAVQFFDNCACSSAALAICRFISVMPLSAPPCHPANWPLPLFI